MILEKVTAFILRPAPAGADLLVFRHPTAGIQLPAGTVEGGEKPAAAVLREAAEETGLDTRLVKLLGVEERPAPNGWGVLHAPSTHLLMDPCVDSAYQTEPLARNWVKILARRPGFALIHYEESDLNQDPPRLLWERQGWIPEAQLALATRRYFYRLEPVGDAPQAWDWPSDLGHTFHLFWVSAAQPPRLIGEQNGWLKYLRMMD